VTRIRVLGVRHHGPGSARSVVAELDRVGPSIVLIEGPADADPLLALAAAPGMNPPVALLGYAPDEPRVSAFWPYAVFSPEWQALLWAARHHVPVRFCDLPAAAVLAERGGLDDDRHGEPDGVRETDDGVEPPAEASAAGDEEGGDRAEPRDRSGSSDCEFDFSGDPIGALAQAAGYDDPERWWDDVIESRLAGAPPFAALTEAMAELRAASPVPGARELRREAYMRQVLRAALRETDGVVAVVCGAWHAPALAGTLGGRGPTMSADAALLRGMAKRKAALAWVPWTHSRLAAASGYGAGVASPGWYHHLFATPDQTVIRWMARVAAALREHDLPASTASVIEAVRLADTLATLRGRPLAGLAEVSEATLAVLCEGSDVAAGFVTRDLVIGEALGTVPPDAPPVPLDADLRACARALKLKFEPLARTIDLDLRREIDRGRSEFLHRLTALGIGWGEETESSVRSTGTFRETWTLLWRPELSVAVIDAAVWGTTVAGAASAKLVSAASAATSLPVVTSAVSRVLLAGLSGALPAVLRALDMVAAADRDVVSLMTAVPALVSAIRYGNVRGTPVSSLVPVVDALVIRVCAGLPGAVGGLADDAAAVLREAMDGLHGALSVYQDPGARERWLGALAGVAARRDVHGLVAGRAVRMLADAGTLTWAEAAVRFAAALSVGVPAAAKAYWAAGFLGGAGSGGVGSGGAGSGGLGSGGVGSGGAGSGGGALLAHDADLLGVLDQWVASLDAEQFLEVLPLLRRTFGEFAAPERAAIGRAVRALGERRSGAAARAETGPGDGSDTTIDAERAAGAVRTVAAILSGASLREAAVGSAGLNSAGLNGAGR
jgi:Family of unknown function (DUF5682)